MTARKQCSKCPWKTSTNPHDIPNGYCETKHKNLDVTIQEGPMSLIGQRHAMACHETENEYCIGWVFNQLGPGNNLGLRMQASSGSLGVADMELVGDQHESFEDTLP